MMTADLHIHTTASDGYWSLEKILRAAEKKGLQAIAITDHDTVDALQCVELYNHFSGEVIPGIELNTETDVLEVHILGYYININSPVLQKVLMDLQNSRIERVKKMLAKLQQLGYALDFEDIKRQADKSRSLGRPHIAAALLEKGYISTYADAFQGLIAKGGPAYVPHYKLTPEEAINTVLAAGGIPVLAHPGLLGDDQYIRKLISKGLIGLEIYHPKHDKAMTNHYRQIANRYNMLVTGGSDFHAIPGRYPEELGEFVIPYSLVETLNERERIRI